MRMSRITTEHIVQYYQAPGVRSRMASFLGGRSLDEATCVYVSRCDSHPYYPLRMLPNQRAHCLNRGLDVGRSLWDRSFLPVHLDIEYVNLLCSVLTALDSASIPVMRSSADMCTPR